MNPINLFFIFWRLWLWLTILFGLLFFSPAHIILISFERTYFLFHLFCRYWCRLVLFLNGYWLQVDQSPNINPRNAYIICPNHTSKFDIILLFAIFPGTFVFMGKKNVTQISIFEWFYNKTMITFERGMVSSAYQAYRKSDRFLKKGKSIVVFPEGGVPPKNISLNKFKLGAFKLAINNQVPVVPVTFIDNKRKYPEDSLNLKLGRLRVVIHSPISTVGMSSNELSFLRNKTYNIINNTLLEHASK